MAQAEQAAEKGLFVIPNEVRDLLFFSACMKQQIPRANPALRNDNVRVFPQPVQPAGVGPCQELTTQAEARAILTAHQSRAKNHNPRREKAAPRQSSCGAR